MTDPFQLIRIVRAVAMGVPFIAAGSVDRLSSTSVSDRIHKFVILARDPIRWGRFEDVRRVFEKSVRVLCASHAGLLLEAADALEFELLHGLYSKWKTPPSSMQSAPCKKFSPPPPKWSPEMDEKLGTASDVVIAAELGTTYKHVFNRRAALGVVAFNARREVGQTEKTAPVGFSWDGWHTQLLPGASLPCR